jgi:hypothetical protein
LIYIAIYPRNEELDELVAFIGDGRQSTFEAAFTNTSVLPVLLNEVTLDGLRMNHAGKLYSTNNNTFWSSFMYLALAFLAFPANVWMGRTWALKVLQKRYYEAHWKKFLLLAIILDVLGVVMLALGAWVSGDPTLTLFPSR